MPNMAVAVVPIVALDNGVRLWLWTACLPMLWGVPAYTMLSYLSGFLHVLVVPFVMCTTEAIIVGLSVMRH